MPAGSELGRGRMSNVDPAFAEVAARDRGDLVARWDVFSRVFRWPFPCRFRWLLPIKSPRGRQVPHGFGDPGDSFLPTSPHPIEAWS